MFKFLSFVVPAVVLLALTSGLAQRGSQEATAEKPSGEQSIQPDRVCLRIQLGLKDEQETAWDGSLEVAGGKIARLDFWRKGQPDRIEGNQWKLSSRPAPRFNPAKNKQLPMNETGILVTLDGVQETSEIKITTQQGNFSFQLADVPYGQRLMRLEGRVDVTRVPASYQLTAAATEEDYPAAALAADGTVYVAYVAFTHGKDFAKRPVFQADQEPDLSNLDQPSGGDRIWVLRIKDGQWSAPMPVTKGGEDLYKTAIAVDGGGRPWVFWSAHVDGNFDLYASNLQDGAWSAPQRLTTDPGPDLNPAAAADAKGRVWVTWQGFRGDNSNILALRQEGEKFSAEIVVSNDPANEWDPAIATSPGGDVAIAWDSYARGNYDVSYAASAAGKEFGTAVPVAATLGQEAHASVAYDGAGRLVGRLGGRPGGLGQGFRGARQGRLAAVRRRPAQRRPRVLSRRPPDGDQRRPRYGAGRRWRGEAGQSQAESGRPTQGRPRTCDAGGRCQQPASAGGGFGGTRLAGVPLAHAAFLVLGGYGVVRVLDLLRG